MRNSNLSEWTGFITGIASDAPEDIYYFELFKEWEFDRKPTTLNRFNGRSFLERFDRDRLDRKPTLEETLEDRVMGWVLENIALQTQALRCAIEHILPMDWLEDCRKRLEQRVKDNEGVEEIYKIALRQRTDVNDIIKFKKSKRWWLWC